MKAVILAGGKGTRGKPYTDYFPKAMTPINAKPLIEYIVKYLDSHKFINEIIIVSDYNGLGGQVQNYLGELKIGAKLSFVQDSQSGTGGDLLHISSKIKEPEFILWFVDNLCAINLKDMWEQFKRKKSLACIATRSSRKEETGFAKVQDGVIQEFVEKPMMNLQMSECLGVYIVSKSILSKIKAKSKKKDVNLSFDILQELSKEGKVSSFDIGKSLWADVESPVFVERNQKMINDIIKQMKV